MTANVGQLYKHPGERRRGLALGVVRSNEITGRAGR